MREMINTFGFPVQLRTIYRDVFEEKGARRESPAEQKQKQVRERDRDRDNERRRET